MAVKARPCALIVVQTAAESAATGQPPFHRQTRIGGIEPIGRAPGEHSLRHLGSPRDAALDGHRALRAPMPRLAIVAQRRERGVITGVQSCCRDGNRPTSAVWAAAMTAARRDVPWWGRL